MLPGGTLERYLPHYAGDEYDLSENAKQNAVYAEIEAMSNLETEDALADRYGDLYEAVKNLPSKAEVDVDPVLRNYLSRYIYELQRTVVNNPAWQIDRIRLHLNTHQPSWNNVFVIRQFESDSNGGFSATLGIIEMLGQQERVVRVNDRTNAGKGNFQIESVQMANGNRQ